MTGTGLKAVEGKERSRDVAWTQGLQRKKTDEENSDNKTKQGISVLFF